jgi:benzoyl-CoA reductase/2-hydroxyglutaryl-CoA dehydratase subunit BcrC/BadD/HgdB
MSAITIELPNSLRERLESIAKQEGIPLNELLVEMVGKISANPVLDKIKKNARDRDTRMAFKKLLASVPDAEPTHGDDVIK